MHVTFGVGNSGTVALVIARGPSRAEWGVLRSVCRCLRESTIEPGFLLESDGDLPPDCSRKQQASRYVFNSNDGQGPVIVTLQGTGT